MSLRESSPVDAVLALDVSQDRQTVLLTLHFESDTAVRLPMSPETAMRLWAVLDKARQAEGWSAPSMPVSIDRMQ